MIVLLTRDLLFASRFGAAADSLGLPLQTKLSAEQVIAECQTGRVSGLLIDLETPDLEVEAVVNSVKTMVRDIVAYGPHVHTQRLADARQAGCDVMSRGELDRSISEVLMRLAPRS